MISTYLFRATASLAASAAAAISAGLAAQPVSVRAEPVNETVHGIALTDEYRWMEDPANRDELLAFVKTENARTEAMLAALPERAWFARRLEQISSNLDRVAGYMECGGTALYRRAGAGDRVAKIFLRDAAGERLLLNPASLAGNDLASFGAAEFSPDCKRLSVHVSEGGSELGKVLIIDIATGQQLGQPIDRIWGEFPVMFVGQDKVVYTQIAADPAGGDPMVGMTAYVAPIAGGAAVPVLGNGMAVPPENFPVVVVPTGEPFITGIAAGARADIEFFVAPAAGLAAGRPAWKQVVTLADQVGMALPLGHDLFSLSTKANPSGAITRRPLADDGTPGASETVFEGSPDRLLRDFRVSGDGVYIHATSDGAARLFFMPGGRGQVQEIALPFESALGELRPDADGRGMTITLAGWTRGVTAYHAEDGKLTATGIASQVWDGAESMAVIRMEAVSKDGTKVPLVVMRRKGDKGRVPTIVEAYGGYGFDTVTPVYGRNDMVWLDRGGAFAYCGTRGGGERGRAWHEGGRGPNKPRAMEDLAACARTLTEAGIAPEQGPLITGGSMGGTLVPTAALTDRAAFGAQVTAVGIVNPTRIAFAENGANQFAEMGDPSDPQQFRDLLAMDAYQMLASSASPPPPSLMTIGLNDRRVSPWMTAKWVARARAKWPDAPIYLRGDADAGHGIGSAEDVRRNEMADVFAFAWAQQSR